MPAVQLGATLAELEVLEGRLRQSAGAIATENSNVVASTGNAVTTLTEGSNTAQANITTFMGNLRADVGAVVADATNTAWTGANRDGFIGNYETFRTEMNTAADATTDYYTNLQTNINTMMADLEAYQQQVSAALGSAQTASESMAVAVAGQRNNLDTAMNTGMNFG